MMGMKKIALILTSIILIFSFSAFSANAADVSLFSASENEAIEPQTEPENDSLPTYYSSADLGYTTAVKTQTGDLCWVYSSLASFETFIIKNRSFYGYLSVDALDNWGTIHEDGEGWQRNSKESGYTYIPIGNFISWNGPRALFDNSLRYGTTKLRYINRSDTEQIKRDIMESGAVTANLNYKSEASSLDRTSYFLPDIGSSISGHSVSVVGWDDNYSKDKFDGTYQPENDGAWLCKNSWGNNNSIGGYLWISYEDFYLFNDDFLAPSFTVLDLHKIEKTDSVYQNEEYGATYEFNYIDEDKVTYFNVFDFSEKGDILDKVVFESTCVGADYEVFFVPVGEDEKPVTDREQWQSLGSGKVDYSGYICHDFDKLTVAPVKAAIAVEIDSSNTDAKNGIGVSEWLRNKNTKNMIFIDTCKSGKSFIESSAGLVDVRDYYTDTLNDEIGGTLVIKAIATGRGDVNLDGVEDINDVTLIQQHIAKFDVKFTDKQKAIADVNGDGVVNINDATAIQIDLL